MFYRKSYFLRLPNRNISDPNLIFQSYVSHMHVKKAKFNYADASVKLKKITFFESKLNPWVWGVVWRTGAEDISIFDGRVKWAVGDLTGKLSGRLGIWRGTVNTYPKNELGSGTFNWTVKTLFCLYSFGNEVDWNRQKVLIEKGG